MPSWRDPNEDDFRAGQRSFGPRKERDKRELDSSSQSSTSDRITKSEGSTKASEQLSSSHSYFQWHVLRGPLFLIVAFLVGAVLAYSAQEFRLAVYESQVKKFTATSLAKLETDLAKTKEELATANAKAASASATANTAQRKVSELCSRVVVLLNEIETLKAEYQSSYKPRSVTRCE